jgi:hypothetical protein
MLIAGHTFALTGSTTISLNQEGTISLSGNGFGNAPHIVIADSFESASETHPERVSMTARKGVWDAESYFGALQYKGVGHGGQNSLAAWDHEHNAQSSVTVRFDPSTDVFISYWVKLHGPWYPGKSTQMRTFSPDSSWKFTWLTDQGHGSEYSNLCLPTHVGNGIHYLSGNAHNMVIYADKGETGSWWSWDEWMRLDFFIDGDPDTHKGTAVFDTFSKDKGYRNRVYQDVDVFAPQLPHSRIYQQISFPGWIRSNSFTQDGQTTPLYDDVYVAIGPDARKRFEIRDAATLDEAKDTRILIPESWTDSQVVLKDIDPDFNPAGWHLVFIDSDGNENYLGVIGHAKPAPPRLENIR